MTTVLTTVLYTLVVVVALLIIALVLIQQSKGGGFGSAFGGAGDSVFGAHAGSHLTKLTVALTAIFFILTLTLAIITGHGNRDEASLLAAKIEETPGRKLDTAKRTAPPVRRIPANKVKTPLLPKTPGER